MFNMRSPWYCPKPEHKFWQQPQSTPSRSLLSHSCTPFAKGTPSVSWVAAPVDCLSMLERIYDSQLKSTLTKWGLPDYNELHPLTTCHCHCCCLCLMIIPNWCWMEFFFVFYSRGERWQPAAGGWVANSEAACHMASVIFYCLTECCVCLCLGGLWHCGEGGFVLAKCCGWAWSWLT